MNEVTYTFYKSAISFLLNINKIKHKYILFNKENYKTNEELKAVEYLKINGVNTFTNKLSKEYNSKYITVYKDDNSIMKYVIWNGKKLYLPSNYCDEQIKDYITFLSSEQDIKSPHCYSNVKISNNSVVIDIGAAEGNFSLDVIDVASKIYLFECDKKWIKALNKTFEPYKNKVEIINALVGKENPIDNYIKGDDLKQKMFIKIDAEGAEKEILLSSYIIKERNPTLIVATYHRGNDADDLKNILIDYGYEVKYTRGLLLFLYSIKTSQPLLRKGLLIANSLKRI